MKNCPHCREELLMPPKWTGGAFPSAADVSRWLKDLSEGRILQRTLASKRIAAIVVHALEQAMYVRSDAAMLFSNPSAKPASRDVQLGRWIEVLGLQELYERRRTEIHGASRGRLPEKSTASRRLRAAKKKAKKKVDSCKAASIVISRSR